MIAACRRSGSRNFALASPSSLCLLTNSCDLPTILSRPSARDKNPYRPPGNPVPPALNLTPTIYPGHSLFSLTHSSTRSV